MLEDLATEEVMSTRAVMIRSIPFAISFLLYCTFTSTNLTSGMAQPNTRNDYLATPSYHHPFHDLIGILSYAQELIM